MSIGELKARRQELEAELCSINGCIERYNRVYQVDSPYSEFCPSPTMPGLRMSHDLCSEMSSSQSLFPSTADRVSLGNEKIAFEGAADLVKEHLLAGCRDLSGSGSTNESLIGHMSRLFDYNVRGGKLTRGLTVAAVFNALAPNADEAARVQSRMLGWSVELLQAFFLVADDVMDDSHMRRGKPCWFREVGISAVNDACLLEQCVYVLLKRCLGHLGCYPAILELFHEVSVQTGLGQALDLSLEARSMAADGGVDISEFSMDHVSAVAELSLIHISEPTRPY
eukprot:TRINITY_DN3224_c0_g1_i7.p1 TRINITY_DN3224_c0_g1~~TRINITY_DN3224_c0_g1_i7.p1  ORF type:complete len:282 (-),score=55.03 TRINITY_DN3224_c0_g1_i7:120-965(-)